MPPRRQIYPRLVLGIAIVLIHCIAAAAHERQVVGPYRLTIGWGDEPAYSGFKNFVSLAIADSDGMPVADPEASMSVEIAFGDTRLTLPMRSAFQRPSEFRAFLVPTRAGTYTFHFTGTVKGQPIEAMSTCSDKTFDCVKDAGDMQFPVKDPSAGQLAERITRTLPRAERDNDLAASTRTLAIGALLVAAVALAVVVFVSVPRKRKGA